MKIRSLRFLLATFIVSMTVLSSFAGDRVPMKPRGPKEITIPTIDISGETQRHVIIAQGTEKIFQGHPTTVLLEDGKTLYAVWTYEHGGKCGPMKKSTDGGQTWSDLLPVPDNWKTRENCPAIYRLVDPAGKSRLIVFATHVKPDQTRVLCQAISEDNGKTWSNMKDLENIECIMPFTTIIPIENGKKYLAATNQKRSGDPEKDSNRTTQWISDDGGLTWKDEQVICDVPEAGPCEPAMVRSPDGKQLLCLLRTQASFLVNPKKSKKRERIFDSMFMTSDDEGRTWSAPKEMTASLTGDRHAIRYAPDGRLLICFRDKALKSPSMHNFVGWVGRYEDIINGREGEYRVKLLRSYAGFDCGYAAVELMPDGSFLATTYIKYRPGPKRNSVVSTRFTLAELDAKVAEQAKKKEKKKH